MWYLLEGYRHAHSRSLCTAKRVLRMLKALIFMCVRSLSACMLSAADCPAVYGASTYTFHKFYQVGPAAGALLPDASGQYDCDAATCEVYGTSCIGLYVSVSHGVMCLSSTAAAAVAAVVVSEYPAGHACEGVYLKQHITASTGKMQTVVSTHMS